MNASALRSRLQAATSERVFPGCVLGVTDRQGRREVLALGSHTYEPAAQAVAADTIYDVASLTKVMPTSSLALMLVEQGSIGLDDPVQRYLPQLRHSQAHLVTVRHLLTHGLDHAVPLSSLKDKPAAVILDAIFGTELRCPPGATHSYANATSILLGLLVEKVTAAPLGVVGQELLFDPLGMRDTSFWPDRLERGRIVPTEDDPWRGRVIRGEVHDESAWKLRELMVAGSAGVFSTVPDVLRFLERVLARGGHTVAGWESSQPGYMGARATQLIGKTGFTGCVMMCDLRAGVGLVLLSNCTWPRRKPDRAAIDCVRRDVADLVFAT